MKINYQHVAFVFLLLFALIFYCEYLIYYVVLWRCKWPLLPKINQQNAGYKTGGKPVLYAMFLADTHLLGTRLGHWFDKLRREWQMHRGFATAYKYFQPEVIFFLGDVFDEGKWSGAKEFKESSQRFHDLFPIDHSRSKVFVVAGNHDIGFHYATTPYLIKRFNEAFNISKTGVQRVSLKNIQFVLVNSMAMHGDQCSFCSKATKQLEKISQEFNCMENKEFCELEFVDEDVYSRPILLQHFPLYRESDINCGNEDDVLPEEEKRKNFRPLWDCLSKKSTDDLLSKIKPRFVISGHTHHGCKIKHRISVPGSKPVNDYEEGEEEEDLDVNEISVASFSWRNRNNPNFLLAKITQDAVALTKCYLPQEDSVIRLYMIGILSIVIYSIVTRRQFVRRY